jgi:hypothetical protein
VCTGGLETTLNYNWIKRKTKRRHEEGRREMEVPKHAKSIKDYHANASGLSTNRHSIPA